MTLSARSVVPTIDFSRTPADIAFLRTRDELRGVLLDDLLSGGAVWLSMEGLEFAARRAHGRLLKAAAGFRQGLAGLNLNPHTAVLDWSTNSHISIEALAAFPVVAKAVARLGATVVCCEPRDSRVAEALTSSGLVPRVGARWVGEETAWNAAGLRHVRTYRLRSVQRLVRSARTAQLELSHRAPQLIGPVIVASPAEGSLASERFGEVCRAAGDEMVARGASGEVAMAVEGFTRELAANALSRAQADCVALAVGLVGGSAPHLEVAISDDGIGMAAQIRRKLGVPQLEQVPERYFVADILRGVHNAEEAGKGLGRGRGLVYGLRDLLAACEATILFRSGGVLVEMDRVGSRLAVVSSSSNGLGTTVRVSVPLRAWHA
jgi:hypothetical protein